MKYFLLRSEKSVGEITDKIYKKLSAKRRKAIEAAILKENPELKKLTAAHKGTLVRIPGQLDAGKAAPRNLLDPLGEIGDTLVTGLDMLEKQLDEKYAAREQYLKTSARRLKAAGKQIKSYPNGAELAAALNKQLKESRETQEKNRQRIAKAIKQLQKTAARFAE